MRILFTTLPLSGHFHPLAPIARAAADAGHEVAFACSMSFMPAVEAAAFRAFPVGYDAQGQPRELLFPALREMMDAERGNWMGPYIYIGIYGATMVPDLLALSRHWPPDVIVRDTAEFAGCVAAETLGLPHASVRTSAMSAAYARRRRYREALAPLRARSGLPPDPDDAMPFRYLHLACEPPRFTRADEPSAPTAHLLRPVNFESGDEELPSWVADLPERPTVYATLGTIFSAHPTGRATFPVLLDALRDEPVNLILTVGRDNDPAQFGPQPPNVHIERFIPQSLLLPHCDLVVHQGGFSTITGTLNAGLPMIVIPISADQPENAECCAALGVGRVIGPGERTPEAIRTAVREVLATPSYRTNAEGIRNEMAALPGPEYAVELLERLAVEKQPLIAV